jgi:predicted DNA-binding transcriptional regulator AlpA
MAEPDAQRRNDSAAGEKLYTLSEISQKTGISMPTLQRYKKMYQGRIPAVGQGRKQRYPEGALPVFDELRIEIAGRRGRPRKNAGAPRPGRPAASKRRGRPPGRPPKAAVGRAASPAIARGTGRRGRPPGATKARGRAQRPAGNLLTLTQVSEMTGISYPTLVRYVRLHSKQLPHEGKGRARRFHPQAVDVFRQLRSESGRGGRKKATGTGRPGRPPGRPARAAGGDTGGFAKRLQMIERAQQNLEKTLKGLAKSLQSFLR